MYMYIILHPQVVSIEEFSFVLPLPPRFPYSLPVYHMTRKGRESVMHSKYLLGTISSFVTQLENREPKPTKRD